MFPYFPIIWPWLFQLWKQFIEFGDVPRVGRSCSQAPELVGQAPDQPAPPPAPCEATTVPQLLEFNCFTLFYCMYSSFLILLISIKNGRSSVSNWRVFALVYYTSYHVWSACSPLIDDPLFEWGTSPQSGWLTNPEVLPWFSCFFSEAVWLMINNGLASWLNSNDLTTSP